MPPHTEGLSDPDREDLATLLASELDGGGVEATAARSEKAERCDDDTCRAELAATFASTDVIALDVRAGRREYTATIQRWRVRAGVLEPVEVESVECPVCGFAEFRHKLASTLADMRERIATDDPARLRITGTPRRARVELDGFHAGQLPFSGAVPPGPHEVSISAPGRRSETFSFDAEPGETIAYRVGLPDSTRPRWRRPLGWGSVGFGAAALATGIGLLSIDGTDAGSCDDGTPDIVDADGDCRWIRETTALGATFTALGVVSASLGATLLILDAKVERGAVELRADATLTRVRFELRF